MLFLLATAVLLAAAPPFCAAADFAADPSAGFDFLPLQKRAAGSASHLTKRAVPPLEGSTPPLAGGGSEKPVGLDLGTSSVARRRPRSSPLQGKLQKRAIPASGSGRSDAADDAADDDAAAASASASAEEPAHHRWGLSSVRNNTLSVMGALGTYALAKQIAAWKAASAFLTSSGKWLLRNPTVAAAVAAALSVVSADFADYSTAAATRVSFEAARKEGDEPDPAAYANYWSASDWPHVFDSNRRSASSAGVHWFGRSPGLLEDLRSHPQETRFAVREDRDLQNFELQEDAHLQLPAPSAWPAGPDESARDRLAASAVPPPVICAPHADAETASSSSASPLRASFVGLPARYPCFEADMSVERGLASLVPPRQPDAASTSLPPLLPYRYPARTALFPSTANPAGTALFPSTAIPQAPAGDVAAGFASSEPPRLRPTGDTFPQAPRFSGRSRFRPVTRLGPLATPASSSVERSAQPSTPDAPTHPNSPRTPGGSTFRDELPKKLHKVVRLLRAGRGVLRLP